ncbi:MAG: four helix bundle suffix domain-containing protein [Patescibacteria group bacterium]|nr:four helix bundle suffix domain-containing protein [Patescibacteria group bacterium]
MGGYESLLVYRLAITIDDGTLLFCQKFLPDWADKRTVEQMVQASRSGKQNIVEGSLEKSCEGNIKLTGVGRASYGELLEDFKDFLGRRKFTLWSKNDPRVLKIRAFRETVGKETNLTNLANWANLDLKNPEDFANLMICLIYKETFLLDQLLRAQEEKFVKEGGFRENLFKRRREYLNSQK